MGEDDVTEAKTTAGLLHGGVDQIAAAVPNPEETLQMGMDGMNNLVGGFGSSLSGFGNSLTGAMGGVSSSFSNLPSFSNEPENGQSIDTNAEKTENGSMQVIAQKESKEEKGKPLSATRKSESSATEKNGEIEPASLQEKIEIVTVTKKSKSTIKGKEKKKNTKKSTDSTMKITNKEWAKEPSSVTAGKSAGNKANSSSEVHKSDDRIAIEVDKEKAASFGEKQNLDNLTPVKSSGAKAAPVEERAEISSTMGENLEGKRPQGEARLDDTRVDEKDKEKNNGSGNEENESKEDAALVNTGAAAKPKSPRSKKVPLWKQREAAEAKEKARFESRRKEALRVEADLTKKKLKNLQSTTSVATLESKSKAPRLSERLKMQREKSQAKVATKTIATKNSKYAISKQQIKKSKLPESKEITDEDGSNKNNKKKSKADEFRARAAKRAKAEKAAKILEAEKKAAEREEARKKTEAEKRKAARQENLPRSWLLRNDPSAVVPKAVKKAQERGNEEGKKKKMKQDSPSSAPSPCPVKAVVGPPPAWLQRKRSGRLSREAQGEDENLDSNEGVPEEEQSERDDISRTTDLTKKNGPLAFVPDKLAPWRRKQSSEFEPAPLGTAI